MEYKIKIITLPMMPYEVEVWLGEKLIARCRFESRNEMQNPIMWINGEGDAVDRDNPYGRHLVAEACRAMMNLEMLR